MGSKVSEEGQDDDRQATLDEASEVVAVPKDVEAWNRALRRRASDEDVRDRPYDQRYWLGYFGVLYSRPISNNGGAK